MLTKGKKMIRLFSSRYWI